MNEKDIKEIITNPVYTGIGPYPQLISDKQFIQAAKRFVKDYSLDEYLKLLLANLRASLD